MKAMARSSGLLATLFLVVVAAPGQHYAVQRIAGRIAGPVQDGTQATSALFSSLSGIAVDGARQLYVSDPVQHRVYRIDGAGKVTTLAAIDSPGALVLDRSGAVFVLDGWAKVVRIAPDGSVSVVAGTGVQADSPDGTKASQATFLGLSALAFDAQGRLCLVDQYANKVRRIDPDGTLRTVPGADKGLSMPGGIAVLPSGDILISDTNGRRVQKIAADGKVSTLQANLYYPGPLAVDAAGNVYLLELYLTRLRLITAAGVLQPALATEAGLNALAVDPAGGIWLTSSERRQALQFPAGSTALRVVAGRSHFEGDRGPALNALLDQPQGLAGDAAGNTYIADSRNRRVRRIDRTGVIDTFAGTGVAGYNGDQPAVSGNLDQPCCLAVEAQGTLFIGDTLANRIRAVAPDRTLRTVAGNGQTGGFSNWEAGPALTSALGSPLGLARDGKGNLYVGLYRALKRVSPDGVMAVLNATGWQTSRPLAITGFECSGGMATDAAGNVFIPEGGGVSQVEPSGKINWGLVRAGARGVAGPVAVDSKDNLYLTFSVAKHIWKRTPAGVESIFAGGGDKKPGDATLASETDLSGITGTTFLPGGDLIFALGDSVYRLVTLAPAKLRAAGGDSQKGWIGTEVPLPLSVAVTGQFDFTVPGVAVSFTVTQGSAWLAAAEGIADSAGVASVKVKLGVAPGPVVVTATVAGLSSVTFRLTAESLLYRPGGPRAIPADAGYFITTAAGAVADGEGVDAANVRLDRPRGMAFDAGGNLYIGERGGNRVRRITPQGVISTYAGADLDAPTAVAVDPDGTLYILEEGRQQLRAVDSSGSFRLVGKALTSAAGIAADGFGRVYVCEPEAHRVQVFFPNDSVLVFAGQGAPGPAGNLSAPNAIAVTADYVAYISDPGSRTIWRVSPEGVKSAFVKEDAGAGLDQVTSLAVDASGRLYFGERGGRIFLAAEDGSLNLAATAPDEIAALALAPDGALHYISETAESVLRLAPSGAWNLVGGASHFSGDGGAAAEAGFNRPMGMAVAPEGQMYIADTGNGRVRMVDALGVVSTIAGGGGETPPADGSPVGALKTRFAPLSVLPAPGGGLFINAGSAILQLASDGSLRSVAEAGGPLRAAGSMALDGRGRLVFADRGNRRVLALSSEGSLETLAAGIKDPRAVTVDARGLIYIACDDRIVRIEPDGSLLTVVMIPGGPAGIAFDEDGSLYVSEPHRISRFSPLAEIASIAGGSRSGFWGDDGPATAGLLNAPAQVLLLPNGDVLVADALNHRIRKLVLSRP